MSQYICSLLCLPTICPTLQLSPVVPKGLLQQRLSLTSYLTTSGFQITDHKQCQDLNPMSGFGVRARTVFNMTFDLHPSEVPREEMKLSFAILWRNDFFVNFPFLRLRCFRRRWSECTKEGLTLALKHSVQRRKK